MISRRNFIKQTSVAALSTKLGSWNPSPHHLSLQLYTVRNEVNDLDQLLSKIKSAGYDNLELYGYKDREYFNRDITSFSSLLKANGLTTNSGHYDSKEMLHDRSYNWDNWKLIIEDAGILGQQYVIIPWIDSDRRTNDDFKRIAERLNYAGNLCKDAGITVGYHNHDFEFIELHGKLPYEILLGNTDPSLVVFEMDIYWVIYAGHNPLDLFAKFPGRFALWHLKDIEAAIPGVSKGQTCEVGKGTIDWKKVFSEQKPAGLKYAYVEQEHYRKPVLECIADSARYIRANNLYKL